MSSGDRFPGYKRASSFPSTSQSTMGGRADPVATSDEDDSSLIGLVKRLLSIKLPSKLTTDGRFDTEAFVPSIGQKKDAAAASDSEESSLISLIKRLLNRLTTLLPQTNGRLAVDAQVPIIGSADDAAALSDTSSATLISLMKRLLTRLTTLLPQVSGRLAIDATVPIGSVSDVAATSDTESFTLIALMKRLLTRLTTLLPQVSGRLAVDSVGAVFPYVSPESWLNASTPAITTTTDTLLFDAAGTATKNYLTSIIIANDSAVATVIEIKDGATVIGRVLAKPNDTAGFAFSGFLKSSPNTAINVAAVTTGAKVFVTGIGFKTSI